MKRLTYANVAATLALVFAVLGTTVGRSGDHADAGAGATITGRQIVDGSLRGRDLARNTITGSRVAEAALNKVPRARNADRLGGAPARSYRVRCPADTRPVAGTCVETQARPPGTYTEAVTACEGVGRPATAGRHLPTHNELSAALGEPGITLAPGGELTQTAVGLTAEGRLIVAYITDNTGGAQPTPDKDGGARPFRCVVDPLN